VLEEHRFTAGQAHNVFHGVLDGLDKTGRGLRIFVTVGTGDGFGLMVIPVVIVGAAVDMVNIIEPYVEPDRGIEGAVLIDAQPGEFAIENLRILFGEEIAVSQAAIGNGAADPMNELLDGVFPPAGVDIAVKVLADNDLGGQLAPGQRYFDIILFKNGFAGLVGNFGLAGFPFDFFEGMLAGCGKKGFYLKPFAGASGLVFPRLKPFFLSCLVHAGVPFLRHGDLPV